MAKDYSARYSGYGWLDTGTTRATSTSTGVVSIQSAFLHKVFAGLAWDDAFEISLTQTGGGPAQTSATQFFYTPLSASGTKARFRVRKQNRIGSTSSGLTLASTVSGLQVRYMIWGY